MSNLGDDVTNATPYTAGGITFTTDAAGDDFSVVSFPVSGDSNIRVRVDWDNPLPAGATFDVNVMDCNYDESPDVSSDSNITAQNFDIIYTGFGAGTWFVGIITYGNTNATATLTLEELPPTGTTPGATPENGCIGTGGGGTTPPATPSFNPVVNAYTGFELITVIQAINPDLLNPAIQVFGSYEPGYLTAKPDVPGLYADYRGTGSIVGTLKVNDVLASRRVALFSRNELALLAVTRSSPNGDYAFHGFAKKSENIYAEYLVIGLDEEAFYNADASDYVEARKTPSFEGASKRESHSFRDGSSQVEAV